MPLSNHVLNPWKSQILRRASGYWWFESGPVSDQKASTMVKIRLMVHILLNKLSYCTLPLCVTDMNWFVSNAGASKAVGLPNHMQWTPLKLVKKFNMYEINSINALFGRFRHLDWNFTILLDSNTYWVCVHERKNWSIIVTDEHRRRFYWHSSLKKFLKIWTSFTACCLFARSLIWAIMDPRTLICRWHTQLNVWGWDPTPTQDQVIKKWRSVTTRS